ncbi:MAG: hypothetical protein AAF081_18900, partial [Actinomycetota bacterium]
MADLPDPFGGTGERHDVVIAANRLPVRLDGDGGWALSPGGLVTGRPVKRTPLIGLAPIANSASFRCNGSSISSRARSTTSVRPPKSEKSSPLPP